MRTLFSRHGLHPRLHAINLLVSQPNLPTQKNKRLVSTTSRHIPQPTPCQHLTQRRAQQVLRVQVAPEAVTPEPSAQVR
jgi:hypothetical protein